MKQTVDKCNYCGRTVIKETASGSSDMVLTDSSFLFLCDVKDGEMRRPRLTLREYRTTEHVRHYCLDCFLTVITEWVQKMKQRGPSKIENVPSSLPRDVPSWLQWETCREVRIDTGELLKIRKAEPYERQAPMDFENPAEGA